MTRSLEGKKELLFKAQQSNFHISIFVVKVKLNTSGFKITHIVWSHVSMYIPMYPHIDIQRYLKWCLSKVSDNHFWVVGFEGGIL